MRTPQRSISVIALAAGLVLGTVGCGSDEKSSPTTTATSTTSTAAETTTTTAPDRTQERAEFFFAPVTATTACEAAPTESTTTTAAATTTTANTTNTQDQTRPVQGSAGVASQTEPASSNGPFPTADGKFCITVGERFGDGNDITDATLSKTEGTYQVLARVKPESVDSLNDGFNRCYNGDPTCPAAPDGRGAVAIIWKDTVLVAPSIQTPDLADSVFTIAVNMTERQAATSSA